MSHGSPFMKRWMTDVSACGAGVLFAFGLAISGMTRPSKVLGFLDFFGSWDPTLAFVMGAAVLTYTIGYRWVIKSRKTPINGNNFDLPTKSTLDRKLLIGSALFGIGWGLAGYCPGPAIAGAGAMRTEALMFYVFMTIGMILYRWTVRLRKSKSVNVNVGRGHK